jgi:hypothetical protein
LLKVLQAAQARVLEVFSRRSVVFLGSSFDYLFSKPSIRVDGSPAGDLVCLGPAAQEAEMRSGLLAAVFAGLSFAAGAPLYLTNLALDPTGTAAPAATRCTDPPCEPRPTPTPCTPITGSLSATPATIEAGQSATLSWSTHGTCSATITVAGQVVGRSGSLLVTPPASTAYALQAGTRVLSSLTVAVLPPTCSASACAGVGDCDKQCVDGGALKSCNAWSYEQAADADLDGVPDPLENELARRFFPTLHLATDDFRGSGPLGDWGQLYSGGRYQGDWQFVVRPVTAYADYTTGILNPDTGQYDLRGDAHLCAATQCLEIVYAIPYNWDLGGPFNIGDHRGDAEMYAVLVARKDPRISHDGEETAPRWDTSWDSARVDAGAWHGYTEFATAHTCDEYDSTNYRFRVFHPNVEGVTELWVSHAKHANYFSRDSCNNGACSGILLLDHCWDGCDDATFSLVFNQHYSGAGPLRNAGEESCHSHPSIDHETAYPGESPIDGSYGTYDVWSDAPFGDDDVGRHIALLRAGTVRWWEATTHPYTCWPPAANHPPAPPPMPPEPCPPNNKCCGDIGADGHCSECVPLEAVCQ